MSSLIDIAIASSKAILNAAPHGPVSMNLRLSVIKKYRMKAVV
ncbi:MAG: hypothetical protein WC769_09080 [Thermodesulfovibrionales bacterium]